MTGPIYKSPAGEDVKKAQAFCACGIAGAEAYVFLRLNENSLPEGRFFCAANAAGEITSAVFNTGDLTVQIAPGVPPYEGLRLLRYNGILPPADEGLSALGNADAYEIYRLIGGRETLLPAEERRYVERARALREGYALGFGVKTDGALLSFAWIAAGNVDSALIGDVFTVPDARGRGYARRCVNGCVRAALLHGKTPYVLCEDARAGFYMKMGFADAEV